MEMGGGLGYAYLVLYSAPLGVSHSIGSIRSLKGTGLRGWIVGCMVRVPFPGCCLPCWASTEESVLWTVCLPTITHHQRPFSASIVGSKLGGTAYCQAHPIQSSRI